MSSSRSGAATSLCCRSCRARRRKSSRAGCARAAAAPGTWCASIGGPHGARRRAAALPLPDADRGLAAKKQVFAGALKRVNSRLGALLAAERRDRNLARLREALARRRAEAPAHPAAGPTRHAGARPLPSRKPRPTIHGARIGSASQAVRDGQVKRDARG